MSFLILSVPNITVLDIRILTADPSLPGRTREFPITHEITLKQTNQLPSRSIFIHAASHGAGLDYERRKRARQGGTGKSTPAHPPRPPTEHLQHMCCGSKSHYRSMTYDLVSDYATRRTLIQLNLQLSFGIKFTVRITPAFHSESSARAKHTHTPVGFVTAVVS